MSENMSEMAEQLVKSMKAKLPQAIYEESRITEEWVPMRDGVKLKASLVCPDREKSWPVILIRNPYVSVETILDILLQVFVACGYAVFYVCVRGTLGSEGKWLPFKHEREDGRDVIDWISRQSWCDGNIGTYGQSYLGHTQWSVSDYEHPMLKTMFISVYGTNPYETFYRRGMFRQEVWTEWAAQMLPCNKDKLLLPEEGIAQRKKAFAVTPQNQLGEAFGDEHCSWYEEWLSSQKESDPCWGEGFWKEFRQIAPRVKIPVCLHGGWFDIFLRSQLCAWRELPEKTRKISRFVIGPWHHAGLPGGDLSYPGEEKAGILGIYEAIPWYEHHLKNKEYAENIGVVESYEIGTNSWRVLGDDLKHREEKRLYLSASPISDDENRIHGLLVEKENHTEVVSFVYDPKKPVDSYGGTLIANHHVDTAFPECSCYQPDAQSRVDVVSFFSKGFEEDTILTGSIKANLFVSSDAEATAFAIKVMEVFEDGRTVNIRDDITDIRFRTETEYAEYKPEECVKLELSMLDIDWRVKKGSCIRVDITSSNYPAYHVHPNTTDRWYEEHQERKAVQKIYCGGAQASCIVLPIGE